MRTNSLCALTIAPLALTLFALLMRDVHGTSCNTGEFDNGGTCQSCISNCYKCTTATDCVACANGYKLADDAASATNECNAYNDNYNLCAYGMYSSDGIVCKLCNDIDTACKVCSADSAGNGVCIECAFGFSVDYDTNTCVCDNGGSPQTVSDTCAYCITDACEVANNAVSNCDAQAAGVCSACTLGFYLDTNECTKCEVHIPGCLDCTVSGNTATCAADMCARGYYYKDDSCSPCTAINPYCGGCTLVDGAPTCVECIENYFLAPENYCLPCTKFDANCLTCTQSECTACVPGYYVNSLNVCTPCVYIDPSCLSCELVDTVPICTQCNNGYGPLIRGTGKKRVSSCLECTTPNCMDCDIQISRHTPIQTCNACALGYGLLDDACILCSSIHSECAVCEFTSTGTNVCLYCNKGYAATRSGTCTRCPLNCDECTISAVTGALQCTLCEDGYALDVHSNCLSCQTVNTLNCSSCDYSTGNSVCLSCQKGYILTELSNCDSCGNHIKHCIDCAFASDGTTVCYECGSQFYLEGNACLQQGCFPTCKIGWTCMGTVNMIPPYEPWTCVDMFGSRLSSVSQLIALFVLVCVLML